MINNERLDLIIDYLREHKRATVQKLSEVFFVSPATVRRDVRMLHNMGLLDRSRGEVAFHENSDEVSIFVRLGRNAKLKELTATIALAHLPDFQSVFIDNSSTCLALAERMNLTNKTVITNGLQIASQISRKENVNIIMPGGEVHYNTNSVTGSMTTETLRRFHVDLMLSSCAAVSDGSSYEHSLDTMQLKRCAFEISRTRYLLVDSTKLGTDGVDYRTKYVTEYDAVITNGADDQVSAIRALGVRVFNK